MLDASTICQLKCPCCSIGKGERKRTIIGSGFLSFKDFRTLIDKNPWVRNIELSNRGEILLNPDLLEIIKYAYKKNVVLEALTGVNFNTVKDEVLEAMVKYKFNRITCSIDGASQETYSIYRRNGNFEKVMENIRRLNDHKRKYKSKLPYLTWQFIAFGHNEHEIQTARRMARDLNMGFYVKLSSDETYSPVKDMDLIRRESGLGVSSRTEYKEKNGKSYARDKCLELWNNQRINFDGKVLGCCENVWGDFGNVFTEGLLECLNNEKMNYARQMLTGEKGAQDGIPCTDCHIYKTMQKDGDWINENEIALYSKERDIQIRTVHHRPDRIVLDASTICQLKCPCCRVGRGDGSVDPGFLRFKDFRMIVDKNPWLRNIELSNRGEILLNPDLLGIIEHAYKRNVTLKAANGVNFNTVKDEVLEAMVKYKFASITCAIDGASQETYSLYRRNGNFEKVIGNIKKLNDYKKEYKSELPYLTWQFIAFGHNEHEIPTARQMAKDLNMKFFVKLCKEGTFSPVKDMDLIRRESGLGVSSRTEYKEKNTKNYDRSGCLQLWNNPRINFDGKMWGCCKNMWGDFGNVFREGLLGCFNNEKMNYARQMLTGDKKAKAGIPCTNCYIYKTMQKDGDWIIEDDIALYKQGQAVQRIFIRT